MRLTGEVLIAADRIDPPLNPRHTAGAPYFGTFTNGMQCHTDYLSRPRRARHSRLSRRSRLGRNDAVDRGGAERATAWPAASGTAPPSPPPGPLLPGRAATGRVLRNAGRRARSRRAVPSRPSA